MWLNWTGIAVFHNDFNAPGVRGNLAFHYFLVSTFSLFQLLTSQCNFEYIKQLTLFH